MKQHIDIMIMLIVAFLMLTKPNVLVDFSQTTFGRFILLLAVIATTLHSTFSGLFVAALFVFLYESVFEGMESNTTVQEKADKLNSDYKDILELRKEHCKKNNGDTLFTNSEGETMTLDEVKDKYPHFTFDEKTCINPCDEGCVVSVTEGFEQLSVEERLRPKQSSEHATQRSKDFVQEGF
mgnify:CR=1 FL=1